MVNNWVRVRRTLVGAALLALSVAPGSAYAAAPTGQLTGRFDIAKGTCGPAPAGSYFRMILPTGGPQGPYVSNSDSKCSDQTYTLLEPGVDGGLVTGIYQVEPTPGFDGNGNSLANHITAPARFFGVNFSSSTNPVDPQTGADVAAPSLTAAADGTLSGDLRSFAASWNNQEFNQGAPKPDGSLPGNTAAPTGTVDSGNGAFTLEWASQIVGGPFDKFTGLWHLEGTFTASGQPASSGAVGGAPTVDQSSTDSSSSASATDPRTGAPFPMSSTAPTSSTVGAKPATGQGAAAIPQVPSGSVVVRPNDSSGGGRGWLLIPIGIVGIGAIAFAVRYRSVHRRGDEP
jgi:hypothetical protein